MENPYEVLFLEEGIRTEKEKHGIAKIEEFTPKQEKIGIPETPVFTINKFIDCYKGSEALKSTADKQRLRQYVQSRTEIHPGDPKVTPSKKTHEKQENDRMNISKVPFLPLLSIRTNAIEEIYKELKEFKQNITEIEEKNKVNMQCIEIGKVKIQDLEERYQTLRKKAGFGCSHEERKEELNNKLKNAQLNWKKSVKKLKQKISDLEEEAKDLTFKADNLRNQIFRKGQQQKIVKKKLNDSGSNSENGYHSCDLLNSSGQLKTVIHTPSWNSLYGA